MRYPSSTAKTAVTAAIRVFTSNNAIFVHELVRRQSLYNDRAPSAAIRSLATAKAAVAS